ncbi:MAG: hypothetical protein NTY68_03835, partial [Candidatus Micrarchaeota archaeon]|nr:hypothetical protein [Candidatus Micrarchaeota archaeon]
MAYTDFGMCNTFSSDILTLLAVSSVAVILLSIIVTMLGKLMSNRRMEMWSSNMVYDVITTLIIAGVFVIIFSAFSSNLIGSPWIGSFLVGGVPASEATPYYNSSACIYGNSMSYLAQATRYTLNVAKLATWANANMDVLVSTTSIQPTTGYGFAYYRSELSGQPLYPDLAKVQASISGIMQLAIMTAITADTAQLFLMKMILTPILLSLLAFAIVLRPIPMFKYFSNSIISLMISFMLIFPLVVSFEGMVFSISDSDISSIYSDSTPSFATQARNYDVKMISGDWKNLLMQALLSGFADKWSVVSDPNGGLDVIKGSDTLIKTGELSKKAYHAFFYSSFILSINVISIIAGTNAIATLMD